MRIISANRGFAKARAIAAVVFVFVASPAHPSGPRAYIVGGDAFLQPILTIYNTRSLEAVVPRVDLPLSSRAIVVHPDGSKVYAVSPGSTAAPTGAVQVVDAATYRTIATITVGRQPLAAAISRNGSRLYVPNQLDGTLSVIDTWSSAVVGTILTGLGGTSAVVSADGTRVFLAALGEVQAIDADSGRIIRTLPLSGARGTALTSDGRRLVVTRVEAQGGSLVVIDVERFAVIGEAAVDTSVDGVVVDAADQRAYVAGSSAVHVLDLSTLTRIARVSRAISGQGIAITPDDRHVWAPNPDRTIAVIDTVSLAATTLTTPFNGAFAYGAFIGPEPGPAGAPPVVEFYRAEADRYFVTADAREISDLDRGVHPGWVRTGQRFYAYSQALDGQPVCRFYGLPEAGLDSHFYSASATECAGVQERFGASWRLETTEAFRMGLPNIFTGACAANERPVYRLWNGRSDSNHRYTTLRSVRDAMLARGFVAEGYGPDAVAMCSPVQP